MPTCGNCHKSHPTVLDVKACYKGELGRPGAFVDQPASERQVAFLKELLQRRDTATLPVPMCQRLAKFQKDGQLSKLEISGLLSAMAYMPEKATPGDTVPPGKYAVENSQGVVEFWQVDKPAIGKWAGRTFINLLLGSPGAWRTVRAPRISSNEAMQKITADPIAAAQLFGIKTKTCGRCSSPLSNARSRAAGYGGHCAGLVGWPYPTRDEALRLLDERGEAISEETG